MPKLDFLQSFPHPPDAVWCVLPWSYQEKILLDIDNIRKTLWIYWLLFVSGQQIHVQTQMAWKGWDSETNRRFKVGKSIFFNFANSMRASRRSTLHCSNRSSYWVSSSRSMSVSSPHSQRSHNTCNRYCSSGGRRRWITSTKATSLGLDALCWDGSDRNSNNWTMAVSRSGDNCSMSSIALLRISVAGVIKH